jgi:hypothetical protein
VREVLPRGFSRKQREESSQGDFHGSKERKRNRGKRKRRREVVGQGKRREREKEN